jgi:histidyl-tRNA synthetase
MELSQASDQKGGWVRLKPDTTYGFAAAQYI